MKINPMSIIINLIVAMQLLISCHQKAEPEIYLIPESFTGKVNIIFNRKEGNEKKYQGENRVYEIPSDGVLLTQFTTNDGFINRRYYYKNQLGELKPLQTFEADTTKTNKHLDKTEIGIFLDGISGVYGNSGEPTALEYQEFIVSNYNNLNNFFTAGYNKIFSKRIEQISGLKQ